MFGDLQTKQAITQRAVDVCTRLRGALHDAADYQSWLAAQSSGDLTAAGFTASDITFLRSAFADLNDLAIKFGGGTGDGNHPSPYDYSVNVKQLIGPGSG